MNSNIVIGEKTLNCAKYKMATDIVVSVVSLFPSEPSSYSLISTYTSSQTWTAPEDGYYQIEVFGASGKGGTGKSWCKATVIGGEPWIDERAASGGGGGGGGYACSRIMMKKGDTIEFVCGAVGANSSATITSSIESYDIVNVASGANGGDATGAATSMKVGAGGAGGVASGGNYANANGGAGGAGNKTGTSGGKAGTAGYTGGNAGGTGGYGQTNYSGQTATHAGTAGKAGFIKIYRGNTNISSGGSSSSIGYNVKYTGDLIDCTIEAYDSTGAKRSSNTIIHTNDYILIDPGYSVSLIPDFSIAPSGRATTTEQIVDGKIKITFTSITGSITISIYL